MLGCRVLTGKGDFLRFGGEVMKNVAGYDVSRLMTGAQGTLGVLLEISCKVLPRPAAETTLQQAMPVEQALAAMNRWAGQPVPLSGAVYHHGVLILRLSGDARAVDQARRQIGGDSLADADAFWHGIREQQHAFFDDPRPLWRLSLAPAHPPLDLAGDVLYDWGGAQRWLLSDADATVIRAKVGNAGGHATLFRAGTEDGDEAVARFHPLSAPLRQLHQRLKAAFDPQGVLNFGRLYPDL
jgi:glycolate oxidase FAD binding subunit